LFESMFAVVSVVNFMVRPPVGPLGETPGKQICASPCHFLIVAIARMTQETSKRNPCDASRQLLKPVVHYYDESKK
jgi:hypothetical protein